MDEPSFNRKVSLMIPDDMIFHSACIVAATTEEGFWQIAFADDAAHPSRYLLCQNAFEYDDHDRMNGMDSHYVELNDQMLSAYGGVSRATLWRDRIFIVFTQDVAALFGLPDGLGLRFELGEIEYAQLASLSKKIFADRIDVRDEPHRC